ncbi:hypothetical protein QTP88_011131 [Uroleucon formosanum]
MDEHIKENISEMNLTVRESNVNDFLMIDTNLVTESQEIHSQNDCGNNSSSDEEEFAIDQQDDNLLQIIDQTTHRRQNSSNRDKTKNSSSFLEILNIYMYVIFNCLSNLVQVDFTFHLPPSFQYPHTTELIQFRRPKKVMSEFHLHLCGYFRFYYPTCT